LESVRCETWLELALSHRQGFRFDGEDVGRDALHRAVIVDPASINTWEVIGELQAAEGDFLNAKMLFMRADQLVAESGRLDSNLGFCYLHVTDFARALDRFSKAVCRSPDLSIILANCGLCLLLLGRLRDGWRYYEHRLRAESFHGTSIFTRQLLSDRPSFSNRGSRRVLVWGEQGVGDEVMFGGLLREFRGLCGEMLVQVDRRLVGLFERSLPGVRFFVRGEVVDESLYDEQIPIGSLARYLRPSRESFVGRGGGYLRAKEGLRDYFRERIGVGSGERVIGLSWKSAAPETGAARSLGLEELVSALSSAGQKIRFVNLQYGDVEADIRGVRERLGIEVYSESEVDNREDLEGLAGLIEACDEVVSVGNATAHLAGALGKKTLVLLPSKTLRLSNGILAGGWRWFQCHERCLWYDSVRLLRPIRGDDWISITRYLVS
jgi:tetratricopeptide (TPR) repeat protein